MAPRLTACVITHNEQERLPGCLASLRFCDEVVVVDSESDDATQQIARDSGATVVENAWRGFATQRNVAIDHATGDWVLEVDADERIDAELALGIRAFIDDPELSARHDLATLPMRHSFLGRELGPSMQWPGYRPRLLRRGVYRHDERRSVHEGLHPTGPVYPVDRGAMVHLLADGWAEALADTRAYAHLEATQFSARITPRAALLGVTARPMVKAAYRLGVDGGWRDGWQGAARIALECTGDAVTWVHALRHPPPSAATASSSHFGRHEQRVGAVKLVAVARGEHATQAAVAWLQDAAAAGAEAVLVTATPTDPRPGVRVRPVAGRRPLDLCRALDAERQARTLDGLLLAGPGLTPRLRLARAWSAPRVTLAEAPRQAIDRVRACRP